MVSKARGCLGAAFLLLSAVETRAADCSAALLEGLAVPRLVATADAYELTMRRRLASTERADPLLLKEALRKALGAGADQAMVLRGVTYSAVSQCAGFRIVSLLVKRENVSFVPAAAASPLAAPARPPGPQATTSQPQFSAPPQRSSQSSMQAQMATGATSMTGAQAPAVLVTEESTERLVELWQFRHATMVQLQTLYRRMDLEGERILSRQLVDEISAAMAKQDLPALYLSPRELSRPLTLDESSLQPGRAGPPNTAAPAAPSDNGPP